MVRKIDVVTKTIQTYEKTAQMYSKLHINDREIIPFAEFFSSVKAERYSYSSKPVASW